MTSEVGQGEVPVFPTFKGFRSAVVREVDSSGAEGGNRFTAAFSSAVKGAGSAVAGVVKAAAAGLAVAAGAAITGVAAIAGKGLSRALNIQDAKAQLVGLGNSVTDVDAIMTNALDSVRGTAFGLDAAATIAASSVAAGIKPGEALTRTLKLTADAATIGKSSLSEMGDMVNKVATNGKLTTEVLQQFQGRGIPLLQMVADQYGVTAEKASEMVSKGKVDFATFQTALEKGVGGAALSSGSTARGAFANIGAAFSRLGALFVGTAVDGAPKLFTSIAGAIDRGTEALKPFAAQFSAKLAPAIASLATWIDGIDVQGGVAKITGFATTVVGVFQYIRGVVTGAGYSGADIGWLEGPAEQIGYWIIWIQAKAVLLRDTVAYIRGYLSGEGANVDIGWLEGPAEFIANTILGIQNSVGSLAQGDFSGAFESIGKSLKTLAPAFQAFSDQLPKIGGAVVTVAAAGLTVLTDVLSFLADHVDTIIQFMPLIVAGFIAWRVASAGAATAGIALRTAEVAALPGQILRNGLRLTAAALEYRVAAATRASTTAEIAATGARNGGIIANVRAAASTVAARVAMVAGAVATGVATAAQWALNAAMSANPIALIVIAIAALVAGLVWFFTQTELGQEIWANFTRFLGEAWANIVAVAQTAIALLVDMFLKWTPLGIIISNFDAIMVWFGEFWAGLGVFFSNAIAILVDLFLTWTPLGILIANFGGIVQFFVDLWTNVTGAITTGVDTAVGFFTSLPDRAQAALANLGSLLISSGASLIQGFIDGITGALDGVGDAVGGVLDFAAGFFPHSPAKRGPFSGAGWAAIGKSGRAIIDEFNAGFPSDALQLSGSFAASLPPQARGFLPAPAAAASPGAAAGKQISMTVQTVHGQSNAEIAQIALNAIDGELGGEG
jgi:tape measure domain-containing protein